MNKTLVSYDNETVQLKTHTPESIIIAIHCGKIVGKPKQVLGQASLEQPKWCFHCCSPCQKTLTPELCFFKCPFKDKTNVISFFILFSVYTTFGDKIKQGVSSTVALKQYHRQDVCEKLTTVILTVLIQASHAGQKNADTSFVFVGKDSIFIQISCHLSLQS